MLVQTTDTYAWIDEYKLVATKGEGKYTLTIPAGLGFWSKAKRDANPWVAPEVDFYDNENGATVVVELEADAEFAFYVGAIPEASWVISYTYEACEVDGGSQGGGSQSGTPLAIGTTQINAANAVYVYTAASDGTLTLTAGASISGAVEISYTKNGGDPVVLELSSTVELALVTGDTVVITVVAEGYSSITADWSGASANPDPNPDPITSIAGTYTATDIWGNTLTVVITDTTITFTPPRSPEVVLEYEYDGETVTIYSGGEVVTNPLGGAITAEGAVATTLSYNGTDYTLTVATGGGDQGGDDPQPSLPALNVGANNVTLNEEEAVSGKTYSFAVTEEGTYTFAGDLLAIVLDSTGMQVGRSSVYLAVGNYTVILFNIAEAAGDFVVTVNFQAPATGDEEGDGSEGNPYVWSELPASVTINSDTINKIYYLYTATEDGTLTFTWVSGDSWGDWFEMDGNNTTANNGGSNMSTTMVIAVEAGKTYRIGLGTFDNAGEFEITISFVAGSGNEGGEGDEGDEIVVDRYLYDGFENEIEVTADDKAAGKFYLYFMPDNDGEYEFASGFLFVSAVTLEGTPIEKNNMGKYVLESYVQYVLEISTNYISEAGSYTLTPEYTYPEGHQENPFWYTLGESATASYKNDYSIIWYQFYANATGTLTVTNLSQYANVELLVTAVFGSEKSSVEFDEETFESIYNGSVSLDVIKGRQYFIGISGAAIEAEAEIEFSASIEEGEITVDGTKNLPYAVVIGENEANVEFGEEVCFYYTFTAAGTLTLVTSGDNYSWYYAEDLGTYVDAMLENTLVINGYEGYIVYIAVNTADWSSAVIPFSASFEADPVEVYYEGAIINDGSVANEIVIEDNTYVVITVYGAGQYVITWDNEDALVAIVSWMGNTPIANGDMIEGSKWGGVDLMIYLPDYGAGTVNVTITPYIAPSQDLALGDNTISVTDTTNGNSVTFTATEAGTYNLNVGENTVLIYDNTFYFAGDVLPVTLLAGESVSFNIATEDYSMSDVVLNISVGVEGGEGEATVITDSFKYVPDVYSYRWVLEFNADGTGVLKEQEFGSDLNWAVLSSTEFTYTYDGTDVTIDFADDAPCEDGSYQVGAYYIFKVVFEGEEVSFEIM